MHRLAQAALTLVVLAVAGCGGEEGRAPESLPGTWVLDKEAMREEWIAAAEAGFDAVVMAPPEKRARLGPGSTGRVERMIVMLRELSLVKTINEDGTWSAVGSLAGKPMEARGTWEREGTTITFRQTHVNEEEGAETGKATFADGRIRLRPDPDWPADLVLKKR